jgi:hypothetical protein
MAVEDIKGIVSSVGSKARAISEIAGVSTENLGTGLDPTAVLQSVGEAIAWLEAIRTERDLGGTALAHDHAGVQYRVNKTSGELLKRVFGTELDNTAFEHVIGMNDAVRNVAIAANEKGGEVICMDRSAHLALVGLQDAFEKLQAFEAHRQGALRENQVIIEQSALVVQHADSYISTL